jgi:hypothetical protein
VNKNLKSLSLSLAAIHICTKIFYKTKKKREIEFEVGTYIRKLNGVSDERWSRAGELQELIAIRNWKVTCGARTIPLRLADCNP